jgi:hypothetical protein
MLAWRTFDRFPSGPEAACVGTTCAFSLSTLEVAVLHDCSGFAIIERKEPKVWRWAVVGKDGALLEEGCEASPAEAKNAASQALNFAEEGDDEPLAAQVFVGGGDAACATSLPATA